MNLLALRPYQREAVDAVHAALARGMRRPAVVLPTGAGKTCVFAHLGTEWLERHPGKRILVLAHTSELLDQAMAKWHSVAPGMRVGRVQAGLNQTLARVIVGSVQTLRNENRRRMLRDVGMVICDECFPAGTLVGERPIEGLRVGDLVPSFDEPTGRYVTRPVTAVMSRRPGSMVRVRLKTGEVFACTFDHPIMTAQGWRKAGLLSRDVLVLSFTHDAAVDMYSVWRGDIANTDTGRELETIGSGLLRSGMRPGNATSYGSGTQAEIRGVVRGMWHGRTPGRKTQDRRVETFRADILPGGLPGRLGQPGLIGAHGANQSSSRLSADAGAQSYAPTGGSRQDGRNVARDSAHAKGSGRQWETDSGASATIGRDVGVADRGQHRAEGRHDALALQGGHSASINEGLRRGGWGLSSLTEASRGRREARPQARWARVADVEILESGRDGTYGGVCPDGLVYNIEVEGTHTYLIGSGVVVHNCHHSPAKSYIDILTHFGALGEQREGGAVAVGFTATMMRGDDRALGDVWQDVVYERSIADMIREGYLVRPRGIHVRVDDLDLSRVRTSGGDYRESDLGEAIENSLAPEAICKAITEHADERKILLFAPTVHSAGVIGEALTESGRHVGLIHGKMAAGDRRRVLDDFRRERIQILSGCMVLTEGFDEPGVDCVVLARPTRSRGLYVQIAGRALRTCPGKHDALLLDVVGASVRHSLITGVELFSDKTLTEKDDQGNVDDETEDDLDAGQMDAREALGMADGPLVATEIDLFADSSMAWLRTRAGVFFLAAGERYIAIVSGERGGYDVTAMHKTQLRTGRWVVRQVADLSYAMAWAEGEVTAGEKMTASRERSWRAKKPSEKTVALAARLGLTVSEHARQGEVSNMITLALASKRIDPYLPAWARLR